MRARTGGKAPDVTGIGGPVNEMRKGNGRTASRSR